MLVTQTCRQIEDDLTENACLAYWTVQVSEACDRSRLGVTTVRPAWKAMTLCLRFGLPDVLIYGMCRTCSQNSVESVV